MDENEISYKVRGCIFKVYNTLGPGLFESAYQSALIYELKKCGLHVRAEVVQPMIYASVKIDVGYRMDIVVNNKVVIETKSIESLSEVHHKQIQTYLKLSGLKLGILVNFNTDQILKNIFRKVNGL